jgi:transketolase
MIGAVEDVTRHPGQPTMMILRTVKGKGVSFMEDQAKWHGTPPSDDEYQRAIQELGDA